MLINDSNGTGGGGGTNCSVENPIEYLLCSKDTVGLVGILIKAIALTIIIIFTIFGNVLVLMSVAVSRNLRSSTHYLIVNLAVADLLLGTTVLPFSAVFEVTEHWYFGETFCTIWAAVDVLCCTSSILSLCVISIDRYIGVTRPLAYSTIMLGRRTSILIVLIWASSFAICIGPLLGWKEPPSDDPYHCAVNKQLGYVLFSVTGSFYLPMLIIICVYWKIYKAAIRQTKFLECGQKTTKQDVTLRVHLGGKFGNRMNFNPDLNLVAKITGGGGKSRHHHHHNHNNHLGQEVPKILPTSATTELNNMNNASNVNVTNLLNLAPLARPEKCSTSNNEDSVSGASGGGDPGVVLRVHRGGNGSKGQELSTWTGPRLNSNGKGNKKQQKNGYYPQNKNVHQLLTGGGAPDSHHTHQQGQNPTHNHINGSQANSSTPSPPSSSPERKLNPGFGKIAKFRRQKKAAKTLAIVVGVFLGCWFPFFLVLPLGELCQACKTPDWLFNLFFWLGYFNSCLNPVIYGCTSREFQRAFRRILCRRHPPRPPHTSRAIYRANMCNNNRFIPERNSNGNNGNNRNTNNGNIIPLNHWG